MLSTVGIEWRKGSLPVDGHPTGPPRYATVIPVLQRGVSAPFFTERPRPKLTAFKRGFRSARRIRRGVIHNFSAAAPFRLLIETASTTRPLAELTYRELREALCQTRRSRSTKKDDSNHFFFKRIRPQGCPRVLHRSTARLVSAGFRASACGERFMTFVLCV